MNIRHQFGDAAEAARACAEYILDALKRAIDERGRASLAVSGGRTPALMFEDMGAIGADWSRIDFFFADERCVPPEDKDSNFLLANKHLLGPVKYPLDRVHRIAGELGPAEAARLYTVDIRESFGLDSDGIPAFDVMHHGMGPDGHTASLFPGDALTEDRTGIAAGVRGSKPPFERVTLLPAVLLAARKSVFLLDGEDKRPALQEVLTGIYNPKQYPSQIVARSGKRVDWFVAGLDGVDWPRA